MLKHVFPKKRRALAQAKRLRANTTSAEQVFWKLLGKANLGYKFRRQCALGNYIADFCCVQKRLIIEVDGSVHAMKKKSDLLRTEYFRQHGFRLVRFENELVLHYPEVAIHVLKMFLATPTVQTLPGTAEIEMTFPFLPRRGRGRRTIPTHYREGVGGLSHSCPQQP